MSSMDIYSVFFVGDDGFAELDHLGDLVDSFKNNGIRFENEEM